MEDADGAAFSSSEQKQSIIYFWWLFLLQLYIVLRKVTLTSECFFLCLRSQQKDVDLQGALIFQSPRLGEVLLISVGLVGVGEWEWGWEKGP